MRKRSKLSRRISVLVLLLALVAAMAKPVSIYAQDEITEDGEKKETVQDENVQKTDPSEEKTQQLEKGGGEQNGGGIQQNSENGQVKTGDTSYDTTKPVIEGFEFAQQGQTLKNGDKLKFCLEAYDADSGVKTIEISLSSGGTWNTLSWDSNTWTYDESKKQYTCEKVLAGVNNEKVEIAAVKVIDYNNNYAEWSVRNESYEYNYWFNTEEDASIKVKNFVLEQNGLALKEDDEIHAYIELDEEIAEADLTIWYRHEKGNRYGCGLYYDETEKVFRARLLAKDLANGKWTVDSIELTQSGISKKLLVDNIGGYSFTIEKADVDTEKPVIKSVSVENNGEIFRAGDTVNVTVEATDNMQLSNSGSLYFRAAADIADDTEYVNLKYDEDGKVYKGTLEITEDTYPCEWYVSSIYIRDSENNSADDGRFTSGSNYPYYINVYNGNTFVQPSYDINIYFMALNEKGSWTMIQENQKKSVLRRQTLKDAGITFPEVDIKYQDFELNGWVDHRGNDITGDTQIIENIGYMEVYAKYNQVLVQAVYNYAAKSDSGTFTRLLAFPEGTTYGEVKKELLKEDAPKDLYSGLTFQGWKVSSAQGDDEPIKNSNNSYRVTADYDKSYIKATYSYENREGEWMDSVVHPIVLEKGKTYKDAIEEGSKYMPEDMTEEYPFEKWEYGRSYIPDENEVITNDGSSVINFNVKHKGKTTFVAVRSYYDENGCQLAKKDAVYTDEGVVGKDALKLANDLDMPGMYQGLRFKEWQTNIEDDIVIQNGQSINMTAVYENCIIRYLIDPIFVEKFMIWWWDESDLETIICQVAEKGEEVTIPSSFEGYETVTWTDRPFDTDTFVVNEDVQFLGYGQKDGEEPSNPENPEPDEPENPNPDNPSNPQPGVTLPESAINNIVDTINNTQEGGDVRVDMGNATVVPKAVLEAAKGKDIDIQLNMDGYTWTINGKDIMSKNLKDVNLKVIMNTQNIPNSTIQKLAGDNPVKQLSLVHEGDFGFKASLTVKMGEEYAGKYGNLFYHDSTGKMTFIDAGTIRPDGMVTLGFSHASDYVVVMSNEKMSQASVPSELRPTGNKGNSDAGSGNNGSNSASSRKSAKTGDNNQIMLLLLCSMFALGVIVYIRRRKTA